MPDYQILRFNLPPELEAECRAALYEHPCLGLEFAAGGAQLDARAYFAENFSVAALLESLSRRWPDLNVAGLTAIRLPEFHPEADTVEICSLAGQEIRLLPAPAFGSGRHPTTQVAAEGMLACGVRGKRVLDLGAGTGVLAILAHRLGAGSVTAVEILPEARRSALENFRLNGAEDIALHADLDAADGPFDAIVANILSPTLIALSGAMRKRLAAGGTLILSGILREERASILAAFSGMQPRHETAREEWLGWVLA